MPRTSRIKNQSTIRTTNSAAFDIRNANDVVFLNVDTTDGSAANTYFMNLTPNASSLEANAYQKIGFRAYFQLTGTGTQTLLTRAYHGQVSTQDSVSHSGANANGLIGFFFSGVHNSTGTVKDMMGGYYQATILAAGSSVAAGLVTDLTALRLRVGYGSTGGTGSVTNGYFLNCDTIAGIGATRTFTNFTGINIPNCTGTGITTGYSIKTGTGIAQFGGRLNTAKGTDTASANDITLGVGGNYYNITGNTQINTIATTNWTAGSVLIIKFASNPVVKHNTAGTGASLLLAGSADFSATADDTLTIVYDGTYWREIARTII